VPNAASRNARDWAGEQRGFSHHWGIFRTGRRRESYLRHRGLPQPAEAVALAHSDGRRSGWSEHQAGSGRSTEIVVPPSGGTSM